MYVCLCINAYVYVCPSGSASLVDLCLRDQVSLMPGDSCKCFLLHFSCLLPNGSSPLCRPLLKTQFFTLGILYDKFIWSPWRAFSGLLSGSCLTIPWIQVFFWTITYSFCTHHLTECLTNTKWGQGMRRRWLWVNGWTVVEVSKVTLQNTQQVGFVFYSIKFIFKAKK